MDSRLIISGMLKNTTFIRTQMQDRDDPYHDSKIDFCKFSGTVDALYTFKESYDLTIRGFVGLKYWFETASSFDENLARSIPHKLKKPYQQPRHFDDDILTEAYLHIIKGPLDVRLGKQLVVWGSLELERFTDVVNPLDFRHGTPGVETWEEMKKGLWMIRAVYQTELPGDISIETIFNPGHFQPFRPSIQGSHWGVPTFKEQPFTKKGVGVFAYQQARMLHENDEHRYQSKMWTAGLRLRGRFADIDWTLIWYNSPFTGPRANPNRAPTFISQGIIFPSLKTMLPFIPAPEARLSAIGRENISWAYLPDPTFYPRKVYRHPRYQTFGGTFQTYVDWLHGSIWRVEWYYKKADPLNLGTNADSGEIYGLTRRDVVGAAIQYSDRAAIPWIYNTIGTNKKAEFSLTFARVQILNSKRDIIKQDYYIRRGDGFHEVVSFFFQQAMFNYAWMFTCMGNYYTTSDRWFVVPVLTYTFPGQHWRSEFGMKIYGRKRGYLEGPYNRMDSIIFRLRYEF
jgi:hypothetical protein